jgi:hypothetical protein
MSVNRQLVLTLIHAILTNVFILHYILHEFYNEFTSPTNVGNNKPWRNRLRFEISLE